MNPFGDPSLVLLRDMFAMHAPAPSPFDAWQLAGRPETDFPFDDWWNRLAVDERLSLETKYRYRFADEMIAVRTARAQGRRETT